jgi:hypothetical protein
LQYREALKTVLDEGSRRLLVAAESQAIGKGGISIVAKATGISRPVIRQGLTDLKEPTSLAPGRVRKEGGGRKRAIYKEVEMEFGPTPAGHFGRHQEKGIGRRLREWRA